MKDLLRITHIEDGVCKIEVNIDDEKDGEVLAANLIAIMVNGGVHAAAAICAAATTYLTCDEEEMQKEVSKASIPVIQNKHMS